MSGTRAARRDPEGRRALIVDTAARIVIESGLGALTHRVIAQRAGIPLGSTTYYFPTLDDLAAEAVSLVSERNSRRLTRWHAELRATPTAETLVAMAEDYLSVKEAATVEFEVYTAAARRDDLRPLATAWLDQPESLLRAIFGAAAGRALTMLLDGAVLHALLSGESLDHEALRTGAAAILSAASPERDRR